MLPGRCAQGSISANNILFSPCDPTDTLYVVGGYCRDPLDSVERLPIESLEEETVGKDKHGRRSSASALWQCSTPLPEKRDACRVVVLL